MAVGLAAAFAVGFTVALAVGFAVGVAVALAVGLAVGFAVGLAAGLSGVGVVVVPALLTVIVLLVVCVRKKWIPGRTGSSVTPRSPIALHTRVSQQRKRVLYLLSHC